MERSVRKKWVDGVEYCLCKDEGVFHPCTNFFIDNSTTHGRFTRCKECQKIHIRNNKLKKGVNFEPNRELALRLLENIGYDTTQNIHEQFLQKYNL